MEAPAPQRRLTVLNNHLAAFESRDHHETTIVEHHPTAAQDPVVAALNQWLVRDNRQLRHDIFEFLKDPLYQPNYYLSLQGFRELTSQRMAKFIQQRFFRTIDYIEDPLKFQASLECLSFCDYSLAIKDGVHFTLCGGTIAKLGTEKHRPILDKMDNLTLPGCFGMTELASGSDVSSIQTTAVFNGSGFVINTPHNTASKAWIGGAANTAKICCVFAQLTVNGEYKGIHAFVVRLRDDNGNVLPGVVCKDHGPKMGLNGVDNGQIWFNNVQVPLDALLDKYASVDAQGNYTSPIANPNQRFGVMVSGLTTGRLLIAQAAVDACKSGLTIAIRYALQRPQFGGKAIAKYVTHQRRLYPALATTYAMHLSMLRLKRIALGGSPQAAKQVHILSSGLKAAATWHRVAILQDCRECCGGMGFLSANKIGPMLNDMNVDVTFEGDNTVMMQQVAKAAVETFKTVKQGGVPMVNSQDLGINCCVALLKWRVKAITTELVSEMAASGLKKDEAFDANLDLAVKIGWASVDASTMETMVEEVSSAPMELRGMLTDLCLLYGLTRVEKGMDVLLAGGAFTGGSVAALRRKINQLCGRIGDDGGKVALQLTDGFGIPDHLLQAPIAVGNWQDSGHW